MVSVNDSTHHACDTKKNQTKIGIFKYGFCDEISFNETDQIIGIYELSASNI
tara:strand:+ start:111 stop:266 length:156 start_codon:yes stop_codon:yes gene_type:complete